MIKDTSNMPDLKEKWLQDLVGKVALQLNIKKEMDILSSEIPREAEEIQYLRDRTTLARQRLSEVENALKNLHPRMKGPRELLLRLQEERQMAVEEYESVREKEREIESGLADLPKLKDEIKDLGEEVRESSQRLMSLDASHHESLRRKEQAEVECRALKEDLNGLEQEIAVIRSTKEILGGKRPEHFDADTFGAIQDDIEVVFENFTNEMTGEIEKAKNEIQSLHARFHAIDDEEDDLLSKKRLFPETIEQLRNEVGEDQDREALLTELERLETQKGKVSVDAEEKKEELIRLQNAVKSVENRLDPEKTLNERLKDRLSPLMPVKKEMDNLDNVADEIQRLKDETQRLNKESEVNKALHETINNLNSDLAQTINGLNSSLEEHERVFEEFEQEIMGLFSDNKKIISHRDHRDTEL